VNALTAASIIVNAMPSAAAGVSSEADAESFAAWASTQRRRAALDGAWKVEVSERVVNGTTIRSVASWHDAAKQVGTSSRRAPQQGTDVPARPEQSSTRSATDELRPQRLTARQRRSALRSATHHRLMRLRVLRVHLLAVRFLVRLSHLSAATRALRSGPSARLASGASLPLPKSTARPSAPHDPKLL